ncbi:MAG TPA: transglutaminaseTgpA domain-containing protein [Propionicimonas sp.]|nr:transglutaminaseTgpA domain-containing protein [Propionicimonas sp.]
MRVVSPEAGQDSTSRSRTLTARMKELRPTSAELVDAGFLLLLSLIALFGFASTFDTWHFMLIGALAVALGILISHLVLAWRWHWTVALLGMVLAYFLVGVPVAARDSAIVGFVPTPTAIVALADLAVNGWKQMLTTLPPVIGDGPYLALPFLLGLVTGSIGNAVARRSRRAAVVMITPLALLVAVILLGTLDNAVELAHGLVLAAVGFAWVAVRTRRRRTLAGTGRSHRAALLAGAGLVAVSLAAGSAVGGLMPGADTQRLVLRSYVQPPVEVNDLASPLVGFRKYSSTTVKQLFDTQLFTVEGVQSGAMVRMAVLDDYTGHTWSASGTGTADAGFQRLGARLPSVASGTPTTLTVTFAAAYAQTRELSNWLPSLGQDTAIAFTGANTKTHTSTLRYNLSTGQGLLTEGDRFGDGDQLVVSSVPIPTGFDAAMTPGGASSVDSARYGFLASAAQRWAGNAPDAGSRVAQLAQFLKSGYWSDGTRQGETDYLPGHSEGRLTSFVLGQDLIGSDEQYAATFALLCNQAGFPARVVFGAIVPDGGEVFGRDITAWVEIQTADGWRAIPPSQFTPSRDRVPPQQPLTVSKERQATNVPPPNVNRSQDNTVGLPDNDLTGTKITNDPWAEILKWLLAVLAVVGPPVAIVVGLAAALIIAKAVRRRIRRRAGNASSQVAGAWVDTFDRCRDLGMVRAKRGTRLEQSRIINDPAVSELAVAVDTATFGPQEPSAQHVDQLWMRAMTTQRELLSRRGFWARLWARVNPRSLLPERLASLDLRQPRAASPAAPTSGVAVETVPGPAAGGRA